ncbi:MFS transporter [Chloroflexota bacterium]
MSLFSNLKKLAAQWGGGTVLVFAYAHFAHDICHGILIAMLPLIRAGLGLNYLQSGLLLSAFSITSGISQIPGGWLGGRIGKQKAIAIGLCGVGLTTLGVGLSSEYYLILAILVINGVFAGAYHPSAISLLSGYYGVEIRGKVIGLHVLGGSMGITVGPILGGLIADMLGWRSVFMILGIPALIAIPLILRTKRAKLEETLHNEPKTQNSDNEGTRDAPKWSSIWQALRPVAIITMLVIIIQLVAGSVTAFMPMYLVDKHGVAATFAAMLVGISRGGGMVGSLFGGWLSDRWGRENTILVALVSTGPILYLFTELPFSPLLIVILTLIGWVMMMRQAAIQSLLMDTVPPQLRATVFGLYFGLSMEGMSLMQPVAAHFMDIFGIATVFHVIALVSLALSLVAVVVIKRPRLRR